MSKTARFIVITLAALGALYVAMLLVAFVHVPSVTYCTGYHVMEVPSPSSAYVATVENSSCNGPRAHELQTVVNLSGKGLPANTSELVFSAPSAIQNAGTYSPLQLKLTWLGEGELEIAYPRGVQSRSRVENAGEVKVVYRELASP